MSLVSISLSKMRKPQGYATIVGDLSKKAPTIIEGGIRHKETEIDTVTCFHCCRIFHILPNMDAADMGGLCKQCMQLICSRCVDKGICLPWEKKLEQEEAKQRFRREAGLSGT